MDTANVGPTRTPRPLLLEEKEHDVHKGSRTKITESAASGVVF